MSDHRVAAADDAPAPSRYGPQAFKLLQELATVDYSLAEQSFAHFFKAAWSVLEPAAPFLPNWHIDLVAEYLQAVRDGQIKRLIINIPPRYLKSLEVTVTFPTWVWLGTPSARFINASYSEDLATKHSVDRRLLMQAPWYQAAWGQRFAFSSDQNQKTEYTNDKRGHMVAAGMLGTVTGKGGDYIIIDDPHNPKKAESDVEREATINAYDSTFTSRLDNKRTGRIIVVMQRLHHKDLTGHLLEKGGWDHLKIPATATKRTIIRFPISGRVKVREDGEILHPQREGKKELETAERDMGAYNYAGQYQQNPEPRSGGLLKRHYWRFYDRAKLPPVFEEEIQSWDLAFKAKEDSDFVACAIMARKGADVYVLDMLNERLGFRASKLALKSMTTRHPRAMRKLIEAKANGPALVDELRSEVPGLVLVEVEGSKWERACLCEPMLESGNVYLPLPEQAPWVTKFVDQCAKFPKGENDDMVDAFTQGLNALRSKALDRLKALGQL